MMAKTMMMWTKAGVAAVFVLTTIILQWLGKNLQQQRHLRLVAFGASNRDHESRSLLLHPRKHERLRQHLLPPLLQLWLRPGSHKRRSALENTAARRTRAQRRRR